jgi:hypothetical protein
MEGEWIIHPARLGVWPRSVCESGKHRDHLPQETYSPERL